MPAFYPLGALPLGAIPPHIVVATASNLVGSAPVLGTPNLSEVNAFVANALVSAAPLLGTPALSQLHALTASTLVSAAPLLASPALKQVHALMGNALASNAPLLGSPAITQVHVLTASGLKSAAPVLGTPALTVLFQFLANGLVGRAPVLAAPALHQVHVLLNGLGTIQLGWRPLGALPLGAQPPIGEIVIVGQHLVCGVPKLDTPALRQVHHLTANNLVSGVPILGGAILISPSGLFVRHGSEWLAPLAYGKHGGVWKNVVEAYRHTEGAWELIYKRMS